MSWWKKDEEILKKEREREKKEKERRKKIVKEKIKNLKSFIQLKENNKENQIEVEQVDVQRVKDYWMNTGFNQFKETKEEKVKRTLENLTPKEINELKLWTKLLNHLTEKPHCSCCIFYQPFGVSYECHFEENIKFRSTTTGCYLSFKVVALDRNKNNDCKDFQIKKHLEVKENGKKEN
jgi:hypothetical protein